MDETYTVGEVAALAGVTIRTLHHYDDIGLLCPAHRSDGGYRRYDDADLERLQQILFFRELGFRLRDIRRVLLTPDLDQLEILAEQRRLLAERAARIAAMIAAVDAAADAHERGVKMDKEAMFEVFGEFDPAEHEAEAKRRWGSSPLYEESQKRTAAYGKDQWREAMSETRAIAAALGDLMAAGDPADSAAAMDTAERHRLHIDRWFYPCSTEVHAGLGEMYVQDARFTEWWDDVRPGLASYARNAIVANAARQR